MTYRSSILPHACIRQACRKGALKSLASRVCLERISDGVKTVRLGLELPLLHNPQISRRHEQHDQPEQNPPCPLRHLQDGQQRRQHGQDQGADDSAGVAAAAAEDGGAADDGGGHRGQHQGFGERQEGALIRPI